MRWPICEPRYRFPTTLHGTDSDSGFLESKDGMSEVNISVVVNSSNINVSWVRMVPRGGASGSTKIRTPHNGNGLRACAQMT